MKSEPLKSILYRELSKAKNKELIEIASPLLIEIVNFSTNALMRCTTSSINSIDVDVAPMALYRHIIELTDAIQVLIIESCPNPSVLLLRSSFEALLSLEYIFENDSDYEDRSLSWTVNYVKQRLEMYERFDKTTERGKKYCELLKNDMHGFEISDQKSLEAKKEHEKLSAMLSKPHLEKIVSEYSKIRGKPKWYQLFSGPNHFRELAIHLKRGGQYDMLYKQWSRKTHAEDLLPFLASDLEGNPMIGKIRESKQFKIYCNLSASFILNATRIMLNKFRLGEEKYYGKWYLENIQEDYLKLTRSEI